MGDTYPHLRVAAIQAAPVFLDREASVAKACRLIREAGAAGARLIGFPEGFVPGHPLWYHFRPATDATSNRLAARLFANSVTIPGRETDRLAEVARGRRLRRHGTLRKAARHVRHHVQHTVLYRRGREHPGPALEWERWQTARGHAARLTAETACHLAAMPYYSVPLSPVRPTSCRRPLEHAAARS